MFDLNKFCHQSEWAQEPMQQQQVLLILDYGDEKAELVYKYSV